MKNISTIRKPIHDFLSYFYWHFLSLSPTFSRYSTSKFLQFDPWPLTFRSNLLSQMCSLFRKLIHDFYLTLIDTFYLSRTVFVIIDFSFQLINSWRHLAITLLFLILTLKVRLSQYIQTLTRLEDIASLVTSALPGRLRGIICKLVSVILGLNTGELLKVSNKTTYRPEIPLGGCIIIIMNWVSAGQNVNTHNIPLCY